MGRTAWYARSVSLATLLSALVVSIVPDARFEETQYTPTVLRSTTFARPPDGTDRFFVAVKTGAIYVVENGVLLPAPLATFPSIWTRSECGVIGLAFDPDFATNHLLYAFVTVAATEQQILRLKEENNVATEMIPLITGLPTRGENHDGGGLGFGPEGDLYFSIGDLGQRIGVGDDLTLKAAKISRALPDGSPAPDNPFFDGAGPNDDYIFARGFRNPFTFTFEPGTDRLWVDVVGTRREQIFVVHARDNAGWNAYENNQPSGYITPVITYHTRGVETRIILDAVRSAGAILVRTSVEHGFRLGQKISIAGVADASFNGDVYVSTTSSVAFSALQAGADASSTGGTASTQDMGAAATGGIFYDGTDFPPEYRGNFFWTDYYSSKFFRAALTGAGGEVTSVDEFANTLQSPVDAEVGLDGALYVLSYIPGIIFRVGWVHSDQQVIISNQHLRLAEGGRAAIGVRLALPPASGTATVTVALDSGDADIFVEHNASLLFTLSNYAVPQPVMFAAALDFDDVDDAATFSISTPGVAAESVAVAVHDSSTQALLLSESSLVLDEGSSGAFTVALMEPPPRDVVVRVASSLADLSITGGATLTFTAANYDLPQPVALSALEDDDAVNEAVEVTLLADGSAPRIVMVTILDNDPRPPTFNSQPPLAAVVGVPYAYVPLADGLPVPTISLTMGPGSLEDGVLDFVPPASGTVDFALRAANGVEPDAVQTWSVSVAEDAPPSVELLAPLSGAVLSGIVDWYGSASDDVGVARVEFAIDGAVTDTAVGPMDRYLYKGSAGQLDTSSLADGPHVLAMIAYDAVGQSARAEAPITVANHPAAESDEGCTCTHTY